MIIFTSKNLIIKFAFVLSFKPMNLSPGFVPSPKCKVVLSIITSDIPVGPNSKTRGFSRLPVFVAVLARCGFPIPPEHEINYWMESPFNFSLEDKDVT